MKSRYYLCLSLFILTCITLDTSNIYADDKIETQAVSNDVSQQLFRQYIIHNQPYTKAVTALQNKLIALTSPQSQCDQSPIIARLNPKIISPVAFEIPKDKDNKKDTDPLSYLKNQTIHPANGVWIERAAVKSCGQSVTINSLVTAYGWTKTPMISPLINGNTQIEIYDYPKVESAIKKSLFQSKQCTDTQGLVTKTLFIGYRDPDNNQLSSEDKKGGWFEKWTYNSCDRNYPVNIAVLPDPRTQYRYVAQIQK